MPLVSVAMPVYNSEDYIAEAIESILAQTFTDFDLLIVDDASTDGSAEIIRSYRRRDDRVRAFRLEQIHGPLFAKSFGIAKSRSDIVVLMDAKDISLPERP